VKLALFEYELSCGFDWTDQEQEAIAYLETVIGDCPLETVIHNGKRELKARQYVGVFRLGDRTVQVLPKMYRSTDRENQNQEAVRNLLYMLEYTNQLSVKQYSLASLSQQDLDWFEILTRLFAINLLEEWQRGAFRNYQSVSDTLPVLKGKWNLNEQFRRPERKHLFSVTFDEFTADNQLNRALRYVVERLYQLTRNFHNRQMLHELQQWMEEVTLFSKVNIEDLRLIPITRLNQSYEPLLNLARLFLENESIQLSSGNFQTFAFALDMSKLFEEFVISFIDRHRHEILPTALQNCELLSQSVGAVRYLAKTSNQLPVFQLKPDLVMRQKDGFPLIIDTKYKRLKEGDRKLGVSQADFYQMYAYAQRYDCPNVLLIYPQVVGMSELKVEFAIEGGTITAATIDLCGDLSKQEERDKLIERLKRLFVDSQGV
jgi:5-methylcytosine-specific restriction enzyme subunit McrC